MPRFDFRIWICVPCILFTPLLNGPLTKNCDRRSGILNTVRDPRAPQKCFWSDLRVEFSEENHLLLICVKMPNQTLQLIRYLDSGWNSDLFKKKVCPNPSTNCKVRAVQKWLPFSKNVQKLLSVTVQTCPIWIFFF